MRLTRILLSRGLGDVYKRQVLAFYEQSKKALEGGASIQNLIKMPVREQIGRFKYTKAEDVEKEYQAVLDELAKEVADAAGKGAF